MQLSLNLEGVDVQNGVLSFLSELSPECLLVSVVWTVPFHISIFMRLTYHFSCHFSFDHFYKICNKPCCTSFLAGRTLVGFASPHVFSCQIYSWPRYQGVVWLAVHVEVRGAS